MGITVGQKVSKKVNFISLFCSAVHITVGWRTVKLPTNTSVKWANLECFSSQLHGIDLHKQGHVTTNDSVKKNDCLLKEENLQTK
jgi:hypothetical protein